MLHTARTVLAFDYGMRTIGVAVGNELLGSTTALAPLTARDGVPDWERVRRLLLEWKPGLVLVGLPLNMDGSASEMSGRAERYARRLHGRFQIDCQMVDERLSSFEARSRLAQRGHDAEKTAAAVDSEAARVILESWFSQRQPGGSTDT